MTGTTTMAMQNDPWAAAHAAMDAAAGVGKRSADFREQLYRDMLAVFKTPEGQAVLAYLDRRFAGATYVQNNPTESHARGAQAEVVHAIRRLINEAEAWASQPQAKE